ncbi:MAG: DJ-1/PfpI family protein [Chloroflexi bacterium]|nr:DJ-1/PfpI family protein [Chloroflexota bacterium]
MRIAFVIFNGMTGLDFLGAYDALTRLGTMGLLPDVRVDVCATTREVREEKGQVFVASKICGPFHDYDMVVVPGGIATRNLRYDPDMVGWLETAGGCPYKVSVCTGALLLGAAGILRGHRATTHPSAFRALRDYCREVVEDERVVDDGDVITARGVTASIDLGLYLCGRLAGDEARARIARQMDYPYDWRTAPVRPPPLPETPERKRSAPSRRRA